MGAHNGTYYMLHCWHLRILRRHPEFCKIYAPLVYNMKNLAAISVPLWNTVSQYTYIYTDFLCAGNISQPFSTSNEYTEWHKTVAAKLSCYDR